MKKKLCLLVIFTFVFMEAVACKQSMVDMNPLENEKAENISGKLGEIEVKNREYGTEEILLEGKTLEQLTVTGKDDMFYCNLEENMKMECGVDYTPVLVCKDPVYDITYYVNYGRDYYIYAYRNGETELAVAIPARDLFCREGELYFIADTYGRYQFTGFVQGNVLKYNPKDGNVAVVVDCSADGMMVYPDGICYKQIEETMQSGDLKGVDEKRFFFSFETGKSSSLPQDVDKLRRWNGYLLQVQNGFRELSESDPIVQQVLALGYTAVGVGGVDAINLVDVQGNVKETLQNVKDFPEEYWIGGDSIYYVEQRKGEGETEGRSVFRRYYMQTGIHEDVAVLDYPTNLSFSDMIFCNGVVYFGNGLRVGLDSGVQCYMQNADGTQVRLEYFYTDGENLFCVSNGKLWLFKEQKGTPVAEREFVAGAPLEIGTYVYRLYEP